MSDFSPDDAAYLTADKHKHKHNGVSSDGGERKRSSSKKQPKGILKNSNPHATYHEDERKHGRNKRVDELLEYERPKTSQSSGHGHGHSHSHKKHRREKEDSESSGGSSSPRTSSSDRHHSSSSKKHSHSKRNGDHHHDCNGTSSRSSSSSEKHREQKSLERKSHKNSSEGEKSSKKKSNEKNEQRHRQTSDSDTLESTKGNTSGEKHRERKSSKHRHSNSDHSEEKSKNSSSKDGASSKHKHQNSSNGGTFTKEEGRKIVREGHLMIDDDVEDLTSTFKIKHGNDKRSKHEEFVDGGESIDLDNIEDIYDRPKVPPVRYIPGDIAQQGEEHKNDHKDKNGMPSTIKDEMDESGNTSDGPVYRTVVKTSKKKNGGGKISDNSNTRKTSKNNPFDHEEEFIDSLQVVDAIHQSQKSSHSGGFYENVGFANSRMDSNDNGLSKTYVEDDINMGDDNFITVGEALSSSSALNNMHAKYGRQNLDEQTDVKQKISKSNLITDSVNSESAQPLYDVPRSNPRRVSPTSLLKAATETLESAIPPDFAAEAVYVNDGYTNDIVSSMINSSNEDHLGFDQYDIPRSNKNLSDLIPQEYDIPKNRDSLSTIDEHDEQQEYDIPKPLLDLYVEKKYEGSQKFVDAQEEEHNGINLTLEKSTADGPDVLNDPFEPNLYENQNEMFQNNNSSSNENIYANDDVVVNSDGGGNTNLCGSHR